MTSIRLTAAQALVRWRRDVLLTFRAHNEQAMGHAAIAFAEASRQRRMMAHKLDRARRFQPGDRGGGGPCQSTAGTVPAG
jgi:TPP-dependent trihydroxycyclohexane-1,2-dione (THcHDO) dehydratase